MILEQCKGVHCVDLGESFQTHIYLQNLASIQPTHQQFRVKYYYSQSSFRTPPVPSVFEDNPVYRRRRRRERALTSSQVRALGNFELEL